MESVRDVVLFASPHYGPLQKAPRPYIIPTRHDLFSPPARGYGPFEDMRKFASILQGARRMDRPPRRKPPLPFHDIIEMRSIVTPPDLGGFSRRAILVGQYVMLRRIEYLGPVAKGESPVEFRNSIRVMELGRYKDSNRPRCKEEAGSTELDLRGSGKE